MRKINLETYMETVRNGDTQEDVRLPYDVKNSMIEVLLSRELGLSARGALERDVLAHRIRDCPNGAILLEEEEYKKLVAAVDTIKGWCKIDIEFLHRILDAPEVEVEEVKPKEG